MNDLLGKIRIASPCHARWEDMTGDERVRFCGQCKKHVYDLSVLTAEAAAALVRSKEGRMCAQFYQRADGTILHAEDCPVGVAARQWRKVKHFAGAAASVVLLMFGVNRAAAGETSGSGKKPGSSLSDQPQMVRGKIRVIDPTPTPSPTPKPTPKPKE